MKKIPLTIWAFVLCGCLLISQDILSGISYRTAAKGAAYPAITRDFSYSVLRSPLNLLFPFESFSHEVCRRPSTTFSLNMPNLMTYQYTGMFLKNTMTGSNYIRISENLTFKKGNSFLLVPHTLTLPVQPDLQRMPKPTMSIPRPD
jgi:hypothetical protein